MDIVRRKSMKRKGLVDDTTLDFNLEIKAGKRFWE